MTRSSPLDGKNVVLGVTGSIAAYKAVSLASLLVQEGAVVDVVMTREGQEFVRPLSFQAITRRPVVTDMFQPLAETEIGHVTLGQRADVVVIAPATAHTIARLALGLCDDMLTATVVATNAPIVIVPAMDAGMYESAATQENLGKLRARGCTIAGPAYGRLASGTVGMGRMVEPEELAESLKLLMARDGDLAGWKIVVTAGGTQEPIDPVRFVSNRSSGKMGYAVAQAARDRGASVVLVSAPTALHPPAGVRVISVVTASEMLESVMREVAGADALIMAAAVADYQPERFSERKVKKAGGTWDLRLKSTPDILTEVSRLYPGRGRLLKVGFAAESHDLLSNAGVKLREKDLDLIVANDVSQLGSGFATDTNKAVLLGRDGQELDLPLMPKLELAHRILDELLLLRVKP